MKKLLLFISLFAAMFVANAQSDLIISEYVEGWSNNRALEIYNPTSASINLSDYQIARYSNGSSTAGELYTLSLPDFDLKPYMTFVVVTDKRDPNGAGLEAPVWQQLQDRADIFVCPVYAVNKTLYHNGNDAMALQKTDGSLVDLFARIGQPSPVEAPIGGSDLSAECWTDTPPYYSGAGVGITADHTMIKKANINTGVTTSPSLWNPLEEWDTLPANTFLNLGWHASDVAPANATPEFEQESYIYSISSDSENGYEVSTLVANDSEGDAVKYFLNYGNFVYLGEGDDAVRVEPFALDKETGKLTVVDNLGLDAAAKDTFDLKVVAHDGFSQTGEVLVRVLIDIEIGVKDFSSTSMVKLFPNPVTNNRFTIAANKEIMSVAVTNVIGQEIYTNANVQSKTTSVELNEIPNGVYLVRTTMIDNSIKSAKVIFK